MGSSASKPQSPSAGALSSEKPHASGATPAASPDSSSTAAALLSRLNSLQLNSAAAAADGEGHTKQEIDVAQLPAWEAAVSDSASFRLARTVLSKTPFQDALLRSELVPADRHIFNLKIPNEATKVTNQQASGRCWLFATCNLMRLGVMDRYQLSGDFELSQSYLCFYDWLEKSNWFLEQMLDLAEEPLMSHTVQFLFQAPQNDGGQFSMVTSLLDKYGVVPQAVFPESYNSSNSSKVDALLTTKLREHALELRALYTKAFESTQQSLGAAPADKARCQTVALAACRQRKVEQLAEIYRILSITLGAPPKPTDTFTWDYYSKDGKFHTLQSTPADFYKKSVAPFKADSMISLINDPRNPYDKTYTVDRLGNVVHGSRSVLYANTTTVEMKSLVVQVLKSGKPVWFGCDVGKFSNSRLGILDTNLHNYEDSFGIKFGMSKAERLMCHESAMTHAMMITAAHLDESGNPVRFRIENSWSPDVGDKGFFMMTADWFDEFVYQVVIPRRFCRSTVLDLIDNATPTLLPADDPMGALA